MTINPTTILVDHQIEHRCDPTLHEFPMITPFVGQSTKLAMVNEILTKVPSYGLSSCGYDVRLAPEFKLFTKPNDGRIIDVLNFCESDIVDEYHGDTVTVPPGGLLLGRTVETFHIPDDIVGTATGKSTWARVGAQVIVTPLEPGWSGELVVEIVNGTNLPLKIYAGVGIAQIVFHQLAVRPRVSYGDRAGKYQNQTGVTTSKI